MKRIALIILLVLGIAFTAYGYPNEPDNFRGLKWGSPPTPSMFLLNSASESNIKLYKRKTEKLFIGKAELIGITYVFHRKQFEGVMISFKDSSNFNALKSTLFQTYGRVDQDNKGSYNWLNESGTCIILDYSDVTEEGKVVYMYMPIVNQEQQEDEKDALKGKEDL